MTNFLMLNSLFFFEKSLQVMEKKHERVHLFLDNDDAGKKYISLALKASDKFHNESKLYIGYKDLNEYVMNLPRTLKQRNSFHLEF